MANYIATDTQLTSIADAIRNKMNIPPLGKNLCNPKTLTAIGQGNTTYTASVIVTWDGVKDNAGMVYYSSGEFYDAVSFEHRSIPPVSGTVTRETASFTTRSGDVANISVGLTPGLEITDIQIEQGSSATEYEAYQPTPLEFPDGFVSALTGGG